MGQYRNVFVVLFGIGLDCGEVVFFEGYMDSCCVEVCDIGCMVYGMEDNVIGIVLVLELVRVMSQYVFNWMIVFMIIIGEEQGLFGVNVFVEYVEQENI